MASGNSAASGTPSPSKQLGGHLRYIATFGDSECNSTAAAEKAGWANLCIAGSVSNMVVATKRYSLPPVLSLSDAGGVWRMPPKACVGGCKRDWGWLEAAWESRIAQLLTGTRKAELALAMVFLGDELCCAGVPLRNLTAVARHVRTLVGPRVLLWTNECPYSFAGDDRSRPSYMSAVPPELDLISFDHYNETSPESEAEETFQLMERYLYPRMANHQRAMLVPGTFGCKYGPHYTAGYRKMQCGVPVATQDAAQTVKIMEYYKRAQADTRVVGLCPWHWFDWPQFFNSTQPQFGLGAVSFPKLRAALATIGHEIRSNITAKIED